MLKLCEVYYAYEYMLSEVLKVTKANIHLGFNWIDPKSPDNFKLSLLVCKHFLQCKSNRTSVFVSMLICSDYLSTIRSPL